ncbi:hypothetical protein [Nocardioides terrisoli]|uniref:hypothetical protein n=1 Tax=Nocardioides terrisoli TaxID=3388267 RepID=UPI00287B9528|nr:hypothetical protein [Nocardioides marmorisolisilvae]
MSSSSTVPVQLHRTEENTDEVERLTDRFGGATGLASVLASMNRQARRAKVPGSRVDSGFAWNDSDQASKRWWPQGISSSADAGTDEDDRVAGRRLLVTSWCSRQLAGESHGSRVTFVDVDTLEYRHVLLVTPEESFGEIRMKAVTVHAGGLVWYGPYLHVAGTRRGLLSCRLDDIVEVPPGPESFGHRFVLPVRFGYRATADDGVEKLRYSFVSLDRGNAPPEMVAGEYGVADQTRRLARFALDPRTHDLVAGADGAAVPLSLDEGAPTNLQGAAIIDGTYYLTSSRGRRRLGRLHVGKPGALKTIARALPPGPEDLTYWPSTDMLWSLSEHPGRRFVFCMARQSLA